MLPLLQEQSEWGFVSGRVSVLEGQLAPPALYQTLLGQERVDEMVRQLQVLPIDSTLQAGQAWINWASTLEDYYFHLMLSLRGDCPDPAVVDLFILQGQYYNLKQALLRRTVFPFPTLVFSDALLQEVATGDYYNLPEPAKTAAMRSIGGDKPGEHPLPLDALLDMACLAHQRLLAEQTGAPLIIAYVHGWVLSRTITALARAIRLGVPADPYIAAARELDMLMDPLPSLIGVQDLNAWPALIGGEMGMLFAEALEAAELRQIPRFRQRVAEELLLLAQQGRMQVFGPERVFSYLATIYLEQFNLKLIVAGRINYVDVPVLGEEVRVMHG